MTRVHRRVRSLYYPIVVSPVLTPGVILGISTLVFWDRLGTLMDADYESLYYSGLFLTIVGQSTFISAYTMLVFLARLQRFDRTQEEAALDLGATHAQVFRSEEHTSELQSLMRISYAVFCLKKKKTRKN